MSTFMYRFPACRLGLSGVFCVLCVLEVGRAGRSHLTAAAPSPRGILTQKFGSLYWMEKGSVCPRREPATDQCRFQKEAAARSLSYLSV